MTMCQVIIKCQKFWLIMVSLKCTGQHGQHGRLGWHAGMVGKVDLECLNLVEPIVFVGLI